MTGGAQDSGVDPDLSWIDIAVTHSREVCILGYSDGWKQFGMEHWWEDTFSTHAPVHLEPGAYRWTGYVVGPWDEDEYCVVTKGDFTPIPATPAPAGRQEPKYLVWSNEHKAWWGPEHRGYTRIIANAGRYDRNEALAIAGTRGGGWILNKGNPDEIAIPEQDAIDQYADITRAQTAPAEGGV